MSGGWQGWNDTLLPIDLTVERSVMDSENSNEEELATSLPDRFVWTDEDVEIIAP